MSHEQKKIVHDLSVSFHQGTTHVLMGPNGSGKSSLLKSLLNDLVYQVDGKLEWLQESILDWSVHQRALSGMFLALQYPIAIDGLKVRHFLYELLRTHTKTTMSMQAFQEQVHQALALVHLPISILDRCVHVGFSGGEKKRFELLQIFLIKPKLILLDEIDSGVDVDGLKTIAQVLTLYKQNNPEVIIVVVSHYGHLFEYMQVDHVHILLQGRLLQSSDQTLIEQIMHSGYESYAKRFE